MKYLLILSVFFCVTCSFDYQEMPRETKPQPDMVFTNVHLKRYTGAILDLGVHAKKLEMYDEEKIWAGKGINFIQYDTKNGKETMKGETGILYIEEKTEEYSLGNGVVCHLLEDDSAIQSNALIWKKKDNLLSAPVHETVKITRKDEMSIEGKGFAAHTAAKEFAFNAGAKGTILVKEKDTEEKDASL